MLNAIIAVFCVAVFVPILVWWGRNLSRVVFKREITILSEWLKWIFIVSWTLAVVFLIVLILIGANVISR